VYSVLRPLNHDRVEYRPGDLVELPPEVADYLQSTGTVGEALTSFPVDAPEAEAETVEGISPPSTFSPLDFFNTATRDELVELPKIGGVTADRLIEARPLATLDDAQAGSGLPKAAWATVLESLLG
jgi:DNA uptake protein ComE-like DNA-binding protein